MNCLANKFWMMLILEHISIIQMMENNIITVIILFKIVDHDIAIKNIDYYQHKNQWIVKFIDFKSANYIDEFIFSRLICYLLNLMLICFRHLMK
jgi:hypothetical protein